MTELLTSNPVVTAIIGATAAFFFTIIRDIFIIIRGWQTEKLNIRVREAITEIKEEFLRTLRQNIMEVQDAATTVRITQKQALEDARKIGRRSKQVEEIVNRLGGKNTVSSEGVAEILKEEITTLLESKVVNLVPRFQMGQADLEGKLGKKVGKPEKRTTFVKFPVSFNTIPKVYVSLVKVDLSGNIHRIEIKAVDVNKDGFNLVFETWLDSVVYTASAAWLAIENGKNDTDEIAR